MTPPARRRAQLTARPCELAWWHLLEHGLVGTHPDDLVTAELRRILAQARAEEARAA